MVDLNFFKYTQNTKIFSKNDFIFTVGDYGDEMYVVQEGAVEIRLGEQVVEVVGTGGILGEMVMIGLPSRTASAVALTDCRVASIKANQFRFMVQETPYFAEWILKILAERVMRMNQMIFPAEFNHSNQAPF